MAISPECKYFIYYVLLFTAFFPHDFHIFHLYIPFATENSTYEILRYLLFILLAPSCISARTINSTNIFSHYLEIIRWLHHVVWIHHESLQLNGAWGKRKLLLSNILSNEFQDLFREYSVWTVLSSQRITIRVSFFVIMLQTIVRIFYGKYF